MSQDDQPTFFFGAPPPEKPRKERLRSGELPAWYEYNTGLAKRREATRQQQKENKKAAWKAASPTFWDELPTCPPKPKPTQDFLYWYGRDWRYAEKLYLARWPNGFRCEDHGCDSVHYAFIGSRLLFQCAKCRRQVSLTSGSLLQHSQLPLRHWFQAAQLLVPPNPPGPAAIARELGGSKKPAVRSKELAVRRMLAKLKPALSGNALRPSDPLHPFVQSLGFFYLSDQRPVPVIANYENRPDGMLRRVKRFFVADAEDVRTFWTDNDEPIHLARRPFFEARPRLAKLALPDPKNQVELQQRLDEIAGEIFVPPANSELWLCEAYKRSLSFSGSKSFSADSLLLTV